MLLMDIAKQARTVIESAERYGFRDDDGELEFCASTRLKAARCFAEYLALDEEHAAKMTSWQG